MPESKQFYIPTTSHKNPYGSQRGFKLDDITSLFKNVQWPPISATIKSNSLGIKTRFYHSYIWYPRPLVMLGVTSCLLTHAAIWLGLPESYSSLSTSLLANLELQWAMGNPHTCSCLHEFSQWGFLQTWGVWKWAYMLFVQSSACFHIHHVSRRPH